MSQALGMPLLKKAIALIRKHEALVVFVALFVVYLSNCTYYLSSTDTIPAILLPFNILDGRGLFLDGFYNDYYKDTTNWWGNYYFTFTRGHVLSMYPIVVPLLVLPLYVLPFIFIKLAGIPIDMHDHVFFLTVYGMEKLSAGVIAALSGVFMYMLLRELFGRKVSLAGTLFFALGTSTWTIGSQGLWQHGASELLLLAALLVLVRNVKSRKQLNFVLLGVLTALLVFNRPTNALLAIPLILYALSDFFVAKRLDGVVAYVASAAAVSLPFLAYNLYYFGGMFGAYSGFGYAFGAGDVSTRLAGLLVSPSRGLLIYTPAVLLAIPGYSLVKNLKPPALRNVFYVYGFSVVATMLIYSLYECWWGGGCYGPRFFTDMMPIMAIFVTFSIDWALKLKGSGRMMALAAIAVLIVASIAVQAIGAYLYPVYGFQWGHGQTITVEDQSKLWDWSDTQIGESLNGIFNRSAGYKYIIENGNVKVVPAG
ncbi:putative membrane protein, required for N-linked glycosylation [Methanocella conradii HZ254]|uniref:Membrane protein, required for N-linked glycosylation n=1 Tax=Methanocella conradii (strain DSM 24694 / JCM 17849 / CGMCC 1.5162 / HZ254) TaxID=1041930 RepID=H8I8B1_METCZ|nr:glycosyltransferase family 39 protein [Methanocella conradii]AFC98964.1 putative membrane protein, required for N-linked glycosylation [Methanocella conradii HZ254]